MDDAQEVLRKLGFAEKPINTVDGRWFTVRIMPYRTHDDRIDGVVITFADITTAKKLEAQLREQHAILEEHLHKKSAKRVAGKKRAPLDSTAHRRTKGDGEARRSRQP
jgi:hypothetical protein